MYVYTPYVMQSLQCIMRVMHHSVFSFSTVSHHLGHDGLSSGRDTNTMMHVIFCFWRIKHAPHSTICIEDFQSFLQGFDLLLAAGHTILITLTGSDALRLELVKVLQGSVQLLLCTEKILLLDCQGLRLVLFLPFPYFALFFY